MNWKPRWVVTVLMMHVNASMHVKSLYSYGYKNNGESLLGSRQLSDYRLAGRVSLRGQEKRVLSSCHCHNALPVKLIKLL